MCGFSDYHVREGQKLAFSHAYGAILGAFVGDAAGAPLEFIDRITSSLVEHGLQMKGGGILDTGNGQITDDSEMAMCQLQVLHKLKPGNSVLETGEMLLDWYRKWAQTKPFDIGTTTSTALAVEQQLPIDQHIERVKIANAQSKANGALMRITPIIVWSRNLTLEEKIEIITTDTQLTHPNQSCIDASIAYSLAIQSLIKSPRDVDKALNNVTKYLETTSNEEVKQWILKDSKNDLDYINVGTHIGFVRWGITLAFHFLQQYTPYEDAIRQTLLKGGDTDTNAAIVGGMMGALHGVDKIPNYMSDPVLSFKYNAEQNIGYDRPDFLSPTHLPGLVNQLYHNSKLTQ